MALSPANGPHPAFERGGLRRGREGAGLLDLAPQLDGDTGQLGRHPRRVDAHLEDVVVGGGVEGGVHSGVEAPLEPFDAVVELLRVDDERNEGPFHRVQRAKAAGADDEPGSPDPAAELECRAAERSGTGPLPTVRPLPLSALGLASSHPAPP